MGINLRYSPLEYNSASDEYDFKGGKIVDVIGGGYLPAGGRLLVSRNVSASGDGSTWDKAYKTIGEAVAVVNAAYALGISPSKGRNTEILIGEGWYSETTVTLTASDCTIRGVAPGSRGRVVLYGSLTAGGWDDGNTGPALSITGWNNTIADIGLVNRSATISAGTYAGGLGTEVEHPCILEGTYALGVGYNKFVNLDFMRDQPDAASWGILSYSQDGTYILGCDFNGRSLKLGGISFNSMSGNNHVQDKVLRCDFYGTPTGIYQLGSHNTSIRYNTFDDNGANGETITNPCNIAGGTARMMHNDAPTVTEANFNAGGSGTELANICSDTDDESWPQA